MADLAKLTSQLSDRESIARANSAIDRVNRHDVSLSDLADLLDQLVARIEAIEARLPEESEA